MSITDTPEAENASALGRPARAGSTARLRALMADWQEQKEVLKAAFQESGDTSIWLAAVNLEKCRQEVTQALNGAP